MTLYYEEDSDCIVENHPDYAEFDDEGHLILDLSRLPRGEKRKALANVAVQSIGASDEYEVAQEPEFRWIPRDERGGE